MCVCVLALGKRHPNPGGSPMKAQFHCTLSKNFRGKLLSEKELSKPGGGGIYSGGGEITA